MSKKTATKGRKTRAQSKLDTRDALIETGMVLFAKEGLDGPSLDAICEHAGFTRGAFYVHFRDRDELLSSIAQRGFEQFESVLTKAWDDGRPDTITAFERVGKTYLAFAREEPAFYSAMFESGLPVDLNVTLLAASERAFCIVRAAAERLAALSPPGAPRPPAMMMALPPPVAAPPPGPPPLAAPAMMMALPPPPRRPLWRDPLFLVGGALLLFFATLVVTYLASG